MTMRGGRCSILAPGCGVAMPDIAARKLSRRFQRQAAVLDFAPTFQYGHPGVYAFTEQLSSYFPDGLNHIFLCNSGSEAGDSALKIALAYQRLRGKGEQADVRRPASAVIMASASAAFPSAVSSRIACGSAISCCAPTICRTLACRRTPFPVVSRRKAGRRWRMSWCALFSCMTLRLSPPSSSRPVAGSAGVLPPPKGYLKRLRQICD